MGKASHEAHVAGHLEPREPGFAERDQILRVGRACRA